MIFSSSLQEYFIVSYAYTWVILSAMPKRRTPTFANQYE